MQFLYVSLNGAGRPSCPRRTNRGNVRKLFKSWFEWRDQVQLGHKGGYGREAKVGLWLRKCGAFCLQLTSKCLHSAFISCFLANHCGSVFKVESTRTLASGRIKPNSMSNPMIIKQLDLGREGLLRDISYHIVSYHINDSKVSSKETMASEGHLLHNVRS